MSKGNFEQFLEALGERESGKQSGDPLQYSAQNPNTNAAGKYQFVEIKLIDVGYYNSDGNNDGIFIDENWTGKNGVTSLESWKENPAAQETAIRESFFKNYGFINFELKETFELQETIEEYLSNPGNQNVKTVKYYKLNNNTTEFIKDDNGDRVIVTEELTLSFSGIMGGAHLRGGIGVATVLAELNNKQEIDFTANQFDSLAYYQTQLFDEIGTPIFEYLNEFGDYTFTTADFDLSNSIGYGDATNYVLHGTLNDNTIIGGDGNDTIIGGLGNDTLTGGKGADIFVFNSLAEGIDTITDFSSEENDKIHVDFIAFGATKAQDLYASPYYVNDGNLGFNGTQFAQLNPNSDPDFKFNLLSDIVIRGTVTLEPEQKNRAEQLISLSENSTLEIQYGFAENLDDGRGITAGRAGFTSGTRDMYLVVKEYTAQVPNNTLASFLPRLEELSIEFENNNFSPIGDTTGLEGLAEAWSALGEDHNFRAVQDEIVDVLYYRPAMIPATTLGLNLPLSLAVFYDTIIQHGGGFDPDGLDALIERTNEALGGQTPATGIDEKIWLNKFLEIRRENLQNPDNSKTQEVWKESVGRVDVFAALAAAGNYQLSLPIEVNPDNTAIIIPLESGVENFDMNPYTDPLYNRVVNVKGNELDNTLTGNQFDNWISGGAGNDTLIGGGGNNTLIGGLGADKFVFNNLSEGIDTIQDFSAVESDKIVIGDTFGATSTNQFSYNDITGALSFNDTQFATLSNNPDFIVDRDIILPTPPETNNPGTDVIFVNVRDRINNIISNIQGISNSRFPSFRINNIFLGITNYTPGQGIGGVSSGEFPGNSPLTNSDFLIKITSPNLGL